MVIVKKEETTKKILPGDFIEEKHIITRRSHEPSDFAKVRTGISERGREQSDFAKVRTGINNQNKPRDSKKEFDRATEIAKVKKENPVKKENVIKREVPIKKEIIVKREHMDISKRDADVEKILVENFVSLQKVMTNLAVKFDSLSDQMSKLLGLFEISAKTLAEKGAMGEDKKILGKLDSLLDQNKVIAKGIALLHERAMPPQEQEVQIVSSESVTPMPIASRPPMKFPTAGIPPGHKVVKTVETERIINPQAQGNILENRNRFVTEE
jgi:hypothetical protein